MTQDEALLTFGPVLVAGSFAGMQMTRSWRGWWISVLVALSLAGLVFGLAVEAGKREFLGGLVHLIILLLGGFGAVFGLGTQALVLARQGRGAVAIRATGVLLMVLGAILSWFVFT